MKKFIAVLLAVLMMFSVCSVAFAAEGDTETPAGDSQTVDTPDADKTEETKTPDWLTNLINKLMQALVKVFAKLGIKLAIKGIDISDIINPSTPVEAE